jgi:hypothetical protein
MSYIKTAKTFFAPDGQNNCPTGSHKEKLYGKDACAVYCDPSQASGGNIPCSVDNLSFNIENKNFRYNGTALNNLGFFSTGQPDGQINCTSPTNQGHIWRFDPTNPNAENRSCCVNTTDPNSNCAPDPAYWPGQKAIPPYLYGCNTGNCLTDYSGEYFGEENCKGSCNPPLSKTAKTFFLPDNSGKCPGGQNPSELFRGTQACPIYCGTQNPTVPDYLDCDVPDVTYSKNNGNFRYKGTAINGANGFRLDNGNACYSSDSGADFFRVPGDSNDSCCLPTKENFDEPNCAPDTTKYWKSPTTANNPYLFGCDSTGKCVSSYTGTYTKNDCNNECKVPTTWKCSDPLTNTCVLDTEGTYKDEETCKNASECQPVPLYNCINNKCVSNSDGTMSLSECMKKCSERSKSNLPIILGVSGGIVLIIILVYFFLIKKRKI